MLGELNPCGGGDLIPLLKPVLLIGRRSSCDVCLRFPNVSSHHCELKWENGYWYVRDLASRNGIKVNGERCDSKWLMPGDVLSVAKHRFELNYTTDATAPPPEDDDVLATGLLEKAGLVKRDLERAPEPESDENIRARYEIDSDEDD
jgi:adenylate cyclase